MRGFTGFSHDGNPCFVREEYERAHQGETELQRLEDAVGVCFSDENTAMYYALTHAKFLLYRCESDEIDRELLRGDDKWTPFRGGYVHVVTGEFIYGTKPVRDSYPCWKINEPSSFYFDSSNAVQLSGKIGLLAMAFGFVASVIGGK